MMNCECVIKIEKEINDKLQSRGENQDVEIRGRIEKWPEGDVFTNSIIMITENGEKREKLIAHYYCPFCGNKYENYIKPNG